jgi:hypothetical protein
MNTSHHAIDIFIHVRVMIGVIVGLSIARLLTGIARFIQHPKQTQVYLVHLGWVLTVLLSVIHFWWWEFRLEDVVRWDFVEYLSILFYAILFFLLSALLFPDKLDEYTGFKEYFTSRKRWFFGILALTFLVDVADTLLKGTPYVAGLGIEYEIRVVVYVVLCTLAMFINNQRFQGSFVVISLLYQISWIFRLYRDIA